MIAPSHFFVRWLIQLVKLKFMALRGRGVKPKRMRRHFFL